MNGDMSVLLIGALFSGLFVALALMCMVKVGPWLGTHLAPKLGDYLGHLFPRPSCERGILIVPGFNLAVRKDAEGNFHGASTFEEWLMHAVPEERHRKDYDSFLNRVRFYFYKRREANRS